MKRNLLIVFLSLVLLFSFSGLVSGAATEPPDAPTNLRATADTHDQITLRWTKSTGDVDAYRIERMREGGSFILVTYVGSDATRFTDVGLEGNTKYTYRVYAYNEAGYSVFAEDFATTPFRETIPERPTNLTARAISSTRVDLEWRDNSDNERGFSIERKVEGGTFRVVEEVRANVTTYSDRGLTENRKYIYRVRAFNDAGYSSYSNEAEAVTATVPSAPTNLRAETVSNREIKLTWTDRSDNEEGFKIERRKVGESFREIDTVRANVTTYSDTGLDENTRYVYRVRAYNVAGNSSYTNEAEAITATVPDAPISLRAEAVSEERINLTWIDRSGDETGFRIERITGTGSFRLLTVVPANTTTYADRGLQPGTTYRYRVQAFNEYGNSDFTNIASATTQTRRSVLFTIGESIYYVNGQRRTMDTTPIIVEARTLLPVRFAAESLGAQVSWDDRERKVTIRQNAKVVELWIGENMARVNGRAHMIDPDNPNVKPIVVAPGRTMLPLRFIAESLGYQVDWDAQTREVRVTYVR